MQFTMVTRGESVVAVYRGARVHYPPEVLSFYRGHKVLTLGLFFHSKPESEEIINYHFIFHEILMLYSDFFQNQSINQLSTCLISVSTDSKAHHPIHKA